jgi:hypothetical protein
MPTDTQLLKMFQDMLEQSSQERQAQTKAFQESLDRLRSDMRIFNTLTLISLLAMAGVNVYFKHGETEFKALQEPQRLSPVEVP